MSSEGGKSVTLVGLGNIGSQLLPLLVRDRQIDRLRLIDPDIYEPGNLLGQNLYPEDVGRRKVDVAAGVARRIRPELLVERHPLPIEDVPMGQLRCDLLLGCVDSRRARQTINRIAFRLAIPWIDAAVDGDAGYARVAGYSPSGSCLECRWHDADYRLLEPVYQCSGSSPGPGTNAPAEIGALAASFQLLSAKEALSGSTAFADRQTFVAAKACRIQATTLGRNPCCRFDHHAAQVVTRTDLNASVLQTLNSWPAAGLMLEGHAFVSELACQTCANVQARIPHVDRRTAFGRCQVCAAALQPTGLGMSDVLRTAGKEIGCFTDIGFLPGDLVGLYQGGSTIGYLELGDTHA